MANDQLIAVDIIKQGVYSSIFFPWPLLFKMSEEHKPTILLVEDDTRLAELIQVFFADHGFRIATEPRGDTAIQRIRAEQPDLLILDIMLPGATGFDVCRKVRTDFTGLILMLTARDDDIDQIVGLEMGADDYVTKPVEPRVLLARIRALLRRNTGASAIPAQEEKRGCHFGGLRISASSRDVQLDDKTIDLTTAEFDLLWLLASHAGETLDRDWLFKQLRGLEYDGLDRSIDIGVSRLRKKLGDSNNPATRIKTVRRKGYLFVADAW